MALGAWETDDLCYKLFFEAGTQGMLLASTAGALLDANPEACAILGYGREELLRTRLRSLVDTSDPHTREIFGKRRPQAARKLGLRLLRRNGSPVRAEVSLVQPADGSDDNILGIVFKQRGEVATGLEEPAGEVGRPARIPNVMPPESGVSSRGDPTLRLLFETSEAGVLLADSEERITDANTVACHLLQRPREDLVGSDLGAVFDPSYPFRAVAREASGEQGIFRAAPLMARADGSTFPAEVRGARREGGGLGVVFRDLTCRRGAENAFEQSEERFEALVENAQDLIIVCESDNTIRYISPPVRRILGYEPEELAGVFVPTLLHPEDIQSAAEAFERSTRTPGPGEPLTLRSRHKDGHWVHLETIFTNLLAEPAIGAIVANSRDVTERVRQEEELRRLNEELEQRVESRTAQLKVAIAEAEDSEAMLKLGEEKWRALIRYASDLTVILDADGTIRYESPAVERILGFRPEDRVGTNAFDHLHPDDVEPIRERLAELLERPDERMCIEYRIRDKEGTWHHFEAIGANLLDDPVVGGIVVNTRDITERKRVEEALRQNEELYRSVVEQAAEDILLVDVETRRILEVNAASHASLGYTAEELSGMTLYDLVAHDRESVDRDIERVLKSGHYFVGERHYRHKDGSLLDFEVNSSTISYGGRQAMCIVARDVTERKAAEEGLRRSLEVLLALREAGQMLGSTLESEEVVARLLEIMRRVSNLTTAVISVAKEDGGTRLWRSVGLDNLWPRARFAPEAEAARGAVLESETQRLFRLRRPGSEDEELTGLHLPLRSRDRVFGVLEAYGSEELADGEMIEIVASLTSQAASALENALLYQDLAEREHRLQDLLGQLLRMQEEERRRVSYEVHDGLAQVATAAHQRLQTFARRYPPDSEKAEDDLARIVGLVHQTVGEARRIIGNLRPTALDDFGLAVAVSQALDQLRDEGWSVSCEENLGSDRLPGTIETALFRVVQEALTNARKHAGVREVHVELSRENGSVRLRVSDEGRGFDPESLLTAGPGERVGLAGMRERITLLGGTFELWSRPGEGTAVIVEVPLRPTEEGGPDGA